MKIVCLFANWIVSSLEVKKKKKSIKALVFLPRSRSESKVHIS